LATSNDRQRVVQALHRSDARLTAAAAQAHLGWLEVERRLGDHPPPARRKEEEL
jgi:hypothetical protein